MLIAAFGLPGVMTAWGFAAVRAIAREVLRDHAWLETDSFEIFERVQSGGGSESHVVLASQYPETALIEAVLAAGARPILFLEDMAGATAYLIGTTTQSAIAIVRAVSASAACLSPLREQPSVLAMRRESLGDRPIDVLLASMARHLQLRPSGTALATCGRHLGQPHNADRPQPPDLETAAACIIKGYVPKGRHDSTLAEGTALIINSVLAPLNDLFSFESMAPIVWPGSLFMQADRPDEAIAGGIDLTGAARCLIYGPYLHLPPGQWAARATLSFDERTRDQSFALEAVAGIVVGQARISPQVPGVFAANWTFAISAPEVPVEIRIMLETGAIEGSVSLVDIALRQLDAARRTP